MNKIISFVMVGTNDLEKSSKFYDAVFVHLGLKKVSTTERMISYAHSNDPHEVKFYITKPYNKKTQMGRCSRFIDNSFCCLATNFWWYRSSVSWYYTRTF